MDGRGKKKERKIRKQNSCERRRKDENQTPENPKSESKKRMESNRGSSG